MMVQNRLLFHSLIAKHSTLAINADVAQKVGYDGLEITADKVEAFLEADHSVDDLRALLGETPIVGLGFLLDIERQGSDQVTMLREADRLFALAQKVGARGVQLVTGPLSIDTVTEFSRAGRAGGYTGLLGYGKEEQIKVLGDNLAILADRAREYGLIAYIEALSWTPLNDIESQVRVIERAARDNAKFVIDFWHCYTSGDTPETIAKLDKDLIFGVHLCDSLKYDGGIPNEVVLRDVPTGKGVLNLQEWTDAVKATGYDDWWSCELFCRRQQQENSYEVATEIKHLMERLIRN